MAETANRKFCDLFNPRKMLMGLIWITYFVFLFIVVCFAIRTFFPKKTRIPKSINVSIVDTKGHGRELSAEGKAYLEEQLHTALMEVSGKAESAYNEKFAALLTVLAVFGIAWPVVIAFLQSMSLERDRTEIAEAKEKAESTDQKNQSAMERIQRQEEHIQKLKKEIVDLQRSSYMQYAVFYIKYITDSGYELKKRFFKPNSTDRAPIKGNPKSITKLFEILIECLDAFSEAELKVPSKDTHNSDSLIGIMETSSMAYNLAWNYDSITSSDEITSELNKCISNIEKMDYSLYYVTQASQNLAKLKELLETVHATQSNTPQTENKD